MWEAATCLPVGPPLQQDYTYGFSAVAFSPDGKSVLSGSVDGQLWELATGKRLGPSLEHKGEVRAVAFSPDGKRVLTGSGDNSAAVGFGHGQSARTSVAAPRRPEMTRWPSARMACA